MGKVHERITDDFREWIEAQHMFFVASAPLNGDGHVNVSLKGMDCLRILDDHTVAYLDLTGSGNETSAHLAEPGNGRITMMWAAFEGPAQILRLYGRGRVVLPGNSEWEALSPRFKMMISARQIIVNEVDRVQTSCGYGVPFMDFVSDRDTLLNYWDRKGEDAVPAYQAEKNAYSIDGLKTPLCATTEAD